MFWIGLVRTALNATFPYVIHHSATNESLNMARQTFARTVVKTYCDFDYFDRNNERHKTTVELFGDYDLASAQIPCIRKTDAIGGVVTAVRHKSYYGTMSIKDFDQYCQKSKEREY